MMQCAIDGKHTPIMNPPTTTTLATPMLVTLAQTSPVTLATTRPVGFAVCAHCQALFLPRTP